MREHFDRNESKSTGLTVEDELNKLALLKSYSSDTFSPETAGR